MIIDQFSNYQKYNAMHPNFAKAFELLKQLLAQGAEDGTHTPANDDPTAYFVKLMTHTYPDLSGVKMEAHEQYVDIQVVLTEAEKMVVPGAVIPAQTTEYNEVKDVKFYAPVDPATAHQLYVPAGTFVVFFPGELHAPGVSAVNAPVRKAVIKVKM